jgi:hypothetical protein
LRQYSHDGGVDRLSGADQKAVSIYINKPSAQYERSLYCTVLFISSLLAS